MPNVEQFAPSPDGRYAFSRTFLPPLAMSQSLPFEEGPSPEYIARRLSASADVPLNMAAATAHDLLDPMDHLAEYADVFVLLKKPELASTWRSNTCFAEQRLSGMHPNWIRKVQTIAPKIEAPLLATIERLVGKASAGLYLSSDLYVSDYRDALRGLGQGTASGKPKYLPRAVGWFLWRPTNNEDRGDLVPVGVRIEDDDGVPVHRGEMVTPFDEPNLWLRARTCLQVSDGNVHEMWSHLYGAHFAMEPIAVATGRYLPMTHPLRRLLTPHFRFLLFNNDLGKKFLVNPGGYVDQLLGAPLAGSLEIVKRAAASYDVQKSSFKNDLVARGVHDTKLLPHYPYRDDGLLLWDAIGTYVAEMVASSFPTDAAVQADQALGRWWTSLSAPAEAGLQGVPQARTRETLGALLQHVIFTSGPFHAAVNFPQYRCMAYVPNEPLAAYAPFTMESSPDDRELLAMLPPFRQTIKQLEIIDFLANYHHDQLGAYSAEDLAAFTPSEKALIEKFRGTLAVAEREIVRRNSRRRTPYTDLLPSLVPNSISV